MLIRNRYKSITRGLGLALASSAFFVPCANVMATGTSVCDGNICHLTGKLPPSLNVDGMGGIAGAASLIRFDQGVWTVDGQVIGNLGFAGWKPVVGDWDGDGYDNIGVYSNGTWILKNNWDLNQLGSATFVTLGSSASEPVVGNWDGSAADSVGIYENGVYTLRKDISNSSADVTISFGNVPFLPTDSSSYTPVVMSTDAGAAKVGLMLNDIYVHANKNISKIFDITVANQKGTTTVLFSYIGPDAYPVAIQSDGFELTGIVGDAIAFLPRPSTLDPDGNYCGEYGQCLELIHDFQPPTPDPGVTLPIPISGPHPH